MYKKLILEKLRPEEVNLDSFKVNSKLNSYIWETNDKVNHKIRKQLLKIARDFYKSLDIEWVKIKDIVLTGSLANYNWSKYSDIDVHVIIDYKDVNDDIEMVRHYLKSKKKQWNDKHDIKIDGYDVELYVEDVDSDSASTGVYSLVNEKWLIEPKKLTPRFDKDLVKEKSIEIIEHIDYIISLFNFERYEKALKLFDKLFEELKDMRKKGLKRTGEFSNENIIYKVLRRTGYLEELIDMRNKAYDKLNSIGNNIF